MSRSRSTSSSTSGRNTQYSRSSSSTAASDYYSGIDEVHGSSNSRLDETTQHSASSQKSQTRVYDEGYDCRPLLSTHDYNNAHSGSLTQFAANKPSYAHTDEGYSSASQNYSPGSQSTSKLYLKGGGSLPSSIAGAVNHQAHHGSVIVPPGQRYHPSSWRTATQQRANTLPYSASLGRTSLPLSSRASSGLYCQRGPPKSTSGSFRSLVRRALRTVGTEVAMLMGLIKPKCIDPRFPRNGRSRGHFPRSRPTNPRTSAPYAGHTGSRNSAKVWRASHQHWSKQKKDEARRKEAMRNLVVNSRAPNTVADWVLQQAHDVPMSMERLSGDNGTTVPIITRSSSLPPRLPRVASSVKPRHPAPAALGVRSTFPSQLQSSAHGHHLHVRTQVGPSVPSRMQVAR